MRVRDRLLELKLELLGLAPPHATDAELDAVLMELVEQAHATRHRKAQARARAAFQRCLKHVVRSVGVANVPGLTQAQLDKALAQAQQQEQKRLEAKKKREEVRKTLDRSMYFMLKKDRDEI